MAKLFALEKISKLQLTKETFPQALSAHNPVDSAMTEVFASLPKPIDSQGTERQKRKSV